MKRRDFIRKAGSAAAGAGALAACGGDSAASGASSAAIQGPEVTWRLATSFPSSLDILHGGADRLAEAVSAQTGGNFRIRVYSANEIVPALEVMDGVQRGSIQCGLTAGYYYVGKNPAFAFDSTVPFGLNSRQQNAWMWHGGGIDVLRDVYEQFGIIQFPASATGAQMGGWFRRPVNSLSEMRGLRMRIPGIGGEIMNRLGVSVQLLGGPEIYPALERGAIDATEWVGPYDDQKLGFYQIAKNYYMPGWWEPGLTGSLQINRAAWDELPAEYQQILAQSCQANTLDMLARYDAANPVALTEMVTNEGVQLRTFSEDILEAAWRESNAYLEEQAAANADFNRVYQSWKAFRDTAFPYFAGNEQHYAAFAFPKITNQALTAI